MLLLSLNNISVSFADRQLFSNASFEIYEGDRVGFVGVNGSGKTTLFRLIKGEVEPDEGTINIAGGGVPPLSNREKRIQSLQGIPESGYSSHQRTSGGVPPLSDREKRIQSLQGTGGCRIGFMEQFAFHGERSVLLFDEALTVFSGLQDMELELEELHDRIDCGDRSAQVIERQSMLNERFVQDGGLTYKSRTRSALMGLGFSEDELRLDVDALSGGQRSKLQLAKLLLSKSDLLLLDEPTNHLDMASVEWLEKFLLEYRGAYIVISHDRYFLDKVTTRTIELENRRIECYKGGYTRHLALKEEAMERRRREYDSGMKEIRRLEGIIDQQKRWNQEHNYITIASKQKSIDRIQAELVKPEESPDSLKFSFKCADGCGNDVFFARNISLGFGERQLFRGVDIDIKKGQRVFLTGANGCGKTSLFKIFMGQYASDSGEFGFGTRVKVGYFDQAQAGLTDSKTALDEVWDMYPRMTQTAVRTALGSFLFKGDDVFKRVGELSGGERARIALLKLMLSGANLLLLDEPTNHLDIASCEALENALLGYDGTLLVISHDRYLINKLADRILVLTPNGIEEINAENGWPQQDSAAHNPDSAQVHSEHSSDTRIEECIPRGGNDYKIRKERESMRRRLTTKVQRAEQEMDRLDGLIAQKTQELSELSDYKQAMELSQEIDDLRRAQEDVMAQWEESSLALEEIDT